MWLDISCFVARCFVIGKNVSCFSRDDEGAAIAECTLNYLRTVLLWVVDPIWPEVKLSTSNCIHRLDAFSAHVRARLDSTFRPTVYCPLAAVRLRCRLYVFAPLALHVGSVRYISWYRCVVTSACGCCERKYNVQRTSTSCGTSLGPIAQGVELLNSHHQQ